MTDSVHDGGERLAASLGSRYTLERELGRGGMATVYLAHDVRHDRKVAVKVLRPELAAVIGGARFLQEIRTVANLQHPHILPLFDSGEVDGTVFYVMPFIEGESLRDRLDREKQLPVDDAIRIAREVASALDYAHRRGILHRDVKPENILLQDDTALVADFGIALAIARSEGGTRLTETGMSLGTPHYMSPEQAMGERSLDGRTDIYSLGCVIYEMLVGEPPFTGPTAQAIIARVVTEDPRSLGAQRRTIPPHVEATVHRALEKLPADRFASAAQFADALATPGLASLGAAASRSRITAVSAPPRLVRRWRELLPWTIAAAAVIAAFVSLQTGSSAAVRRYRISLWQNPIAPGSLGRSLAISPDGALVVYVDTIGGMQQLWLKERDRAEATPLAGTVGATGPTFSPDGKWIAFFAEGRVRKTPSSGGAAITVADSANTTFPAIAWLDNGTLLFNDARFNLVAVSENSGATRRIFTSGQRTRGVSTVTPLPGSRGALIATCTFGCPDVDLRILDLRTGETRVLAGDALKGWYVPDNRVVFVRRDGAVFVVDFDLRRLQIRGNPAPVMEGVRTGIGEPDMAVAPNGTLIYIAGEGETGGLLYEPVWVTREGNVSPVEPGWMFTPSGNGGISVSPDGRRIAVSARAGGSEDIWVREVNGPLTRLTFGGYNIRPEWSVDGSDLFYVSTPSEGDAMIRTRRADGSGGEETVLDLERAVLEISRTTDPSLFLVRLGVPPSRDILLWRRGAAGADRLRPLIASPGFDEIAPALSPDGRWLAYASNESGRNEIYVRPFPDVEGGRWQLSRSGGAEPVWARTGRELFYRDAAGDMISVPVLPGSVFATGRQRALFSTKQFRPGQSRNESFDLGPDGRFIFTREVSDPADAEYAPLIQVENWFVDLDEAVKRR